MSSNKNVSDIKKEKCCGCYACYNICPVNAITMEVDAEGFWYPVISDEKCIDCGQCRRVCPNLNPPSVNKKEHAYACYAKDLAEHMSSSSGGIFAILAQECIQKGGIVFGAAFNDEMELEHQEATCSNQLYRLKGTKYVQSRIGRSYSEVKKELIRGKEVLFSGTPCQIAGLKKYLGKDFENLLCIDLICHGVPSPAVWKKYLTDQFGEGQVIAMQFRNKEDGIEHITLDYTLRHGEVIREDYRESPYIEGFINNYYTRPSCFCCEFKGIHRCSDITVGDFWSIREFHPEFYNGRGVSSMITHTQKGERWIKSVMEDIEICGATVKEISTWNESLLKPAKYNPCREVFFSRWGSENIAELVQQLEHIPKDQKGTVDSKRQMVKTMVRTLKGKIANFLKKN